MVHVQPHTEASTQLAMNGLYAVPLSSTHKTGTGRWVDWWSAGNPETTSCLNWRQIKTALNNQRSKRVIALRQVPGKSAFPPFV
jgi:hypothetical protein